MNSDSELLTGVDLKTRYSSGRDDLVQAFFAPCLEASTSYDRAVGFFSSSFYTLVHVPLGQFALKGGKFRLVCSPRLEAADIDAMRRGYEERGASDAVIRELELTLADAAGRASAEFLATLVAFGAAEIKLAFNADAERGLFHDKVGIFGDREGNRVSFSGSANETWSAWSGRANHEYFHAFASWREADAGRVDADRGYFDALWSGEEPGLAVVDFPDVARERLEEMANPDGPEAAQQELEAAVEERPPRPVLRTHQVDAKDAWEAADHRGLLEHATGSGKTITALSCVARAIEAGKPSLILVPTRALLRQWRDETEAYFGHEVDLMLVGGGYSDWRRGSALRDFLAPKSARVVIATMDTAATDDFVSRCAEIHELLVVVDEVHRIGSPQRRRVLEIDADWRLGLSATWEREGDLDGTAAIRAYFEHVLHPPYSLHDAIRDGYLCPYRYLIHMIHLDGEERERWLALTAQIGRAIAAADGEVTESAHHLMIRRAKIVKSARGKVPLAAKVLEDDFEPGSAWLVYCDDSAQLGDIRALCGRRGVHSFEFHTRMEGHGAAALEEFERAGGIMLSINCLDEGVDIPRISHALILASSTTRREFIQRRGRVLRTHETKHRAVVHDVLVDAGGFDDPDAARFVRTELARAYEFLESAVDSDATRVMLDRLARDAGFDPGEVTADEGFEGDDQAEDESS